METDPLESLISSIGKTSKASTERCRIENEEIVCKEQEPVLDGQRYPAMFLTNGSYNP